MDHGFRWMLKASGRSSSSHDQSPLRYGSVSEKLDAIGMVRLITTTDGAGCRKGVSM